VKISDIRDGDVIYGHHGDLTTVVAVYNKGIKKTKRVSLNNGSFFRATENHRIILDNESETTIADILNHPFDNRNKPLKLYSPERLVNYRSDTYLAGTTKMLGYYIADGWMNSKSSVDISGRDGKPKEQQKLEIRQICDSLKIKTTWKKKSISIRDKEFAELCKRCGKTAVNKQLPSFEFSISEMKDLYDGLLADASVREKNGVVKIEYGTISPTLAMHFKTLAKFLGKSTSTRLVENHGGLGKNPIYRVNVRATDSRRHPKILDISDSETARVYDITTTNGGIYLPENDIVVHNCDDFAMFALASLAGGEEKYMLTVITRPIEHSHAVCIYNRHSAWYHIGNWYGGKARGPFPSVIDIIDSIVGPHKFVCAIMRDEDLNERRVFKCEI
jgi:hypothetical protein